MSSLFQSQVRKDMQVNPQFCNKLPKIHNSEARRLKLFQTIRNNLFQKMS